MLLYALSTGSQPHAYAMWCADGNEVLAMDGDPEKCIQKSGRRIRSPIR